MEDFKLLSGFFQAIENDFRISTTHIAIFAALLQFRANRNFINPIQAYSIEIQNIAKVVSPKTYHKCMRELDDYGYLIYVPTKNKNKRSSVYFYLE
ncbi:hypothetical protein NYQ10_20495 [Flavobacterium johnsoniae]|uniref:hypothetical protein n=1 Tax=Flavobacterium TaxID=237 RepID=UPI0015B793F0|nr:MULTISPECIES: hypothetical protein [Flavobacterium]NWL02895.1 hypothetical protein [Flavobacterium collinsii]WET03994.1 hypothetical protein P0R33_06550 [Flavobacterium sp. YJ01]WJS94465.1 hypothetical protein NYQ10_20495 [Flavobacterium johnsoniae]